MIWTLFQSTWDSLHGLSPSLWSKTLWWLVGLLFIVIVILQYWSSPQTAVQRSSTSLRRFQWKNSIKKNLLNCDCKQNSFVGTKCTPDKGALCLFSSLSSQCFTSNLSAERNISTENPVEIETSYLLKVLNSPFLLQKEPLCSQLLKLGWSPVPSQGSSVWMLDAHLSKHCGLQM